MRRLRRARRNGEPTTTVSKKAVTPQTLRRPGEYQGYIIDVDGVLLAGQRIIPGARKTLAALRDQGRGVVLLSNNSTRSRNDLNAVISRFGLPVTVEQVIPSTHAAALYLQREAADAPLYVIGAPGLLTELREAGLKITERPQEAAWLVTGSVTFHTHETLTAGVEALRHGARWLTVSTDRLHPSPHGLVAGGGAVRGALEYCAARSPDVKIGKPGRETMNVVLQHLGLPAGEVLVIGDTLASDIQGGINAGSDTVLVLSGSTTPERLAASDIRPDFVLPSIGDLLDAPADRYAPKAISKASVVPQQSPAAATHDGRGIHLIGEVDLSALPAGAEGVLNEMPAEAAILAMGPSKGLTTPQLSAAIQALAAGARWIMVGTQIPASGTSHSPLALLVGALRYCTGREPEGAVPTLADLVPDLSATQAIGRVPLPTEMDLQARVERYARLCSEAIASLTPGEGREMTVIHHVDADGICAGVILRRALERAGCTVKTIGVGKLFTPTIELIYRRVKTPVLFTDLGGGATPEIAAINRRGPGLPTVIVDHHDTVVSPDQRDAAVYNLCTERVHISGDEQASGACAAWLFARTLDTDCDDLAALAVIGAVADRHTRSEGRLIGANRMALEIAQKRGQVRVETDGQGRETYTFVVEGTEERMTDMADWLTVLGSMPIVGGLELANRVGEHPFGEREHAGIAAAQQARARAFDTLRREIDARSRKTRHLQVVESGSLFEGMALKMIGLFLEDPQSIDEGVLDTRRYLVGFQEVDPEVPGLGSVGAGWVKVSGRLHGELERKMNAGTMPGYKRLFAEVARRLEVSLDACHDYAAALVVPSDRRDDFVEALEAAIVEARAEIT